MNTYRVIVFEKRHRWLPELRRQWQGQPIEVHGCRTVEDMDLTSRGEGRSPLVVLDFDSDPVSCLLFLGRHARNRFECSTLILVSSETTELQWALRELGVDSVLDSRKDGMEVARSCWQLMVQS